MSPEQARGKTVDKRADVWAFGAVLYEMLTGRRCFQGDDVSDTFPASLYAEPNWSALPPEMPPAIRRLLRRSLEKDVRARLSDMAMVRRAPRRGHRAARGSGGGFRDAAAPAFRSGPCRSYAAVIVTVLMTGLAVAVFYRPRQSAEVPQPLGGIPEPLTRLVQLARDGERSSLAEITGMAWFPRSSPDGSRVAYGVSAGSDLNDASDLWVLDVARGARTRVTFTANNRFYPIWTRDGARLTFADGSGQTNRLLWTLVDGSGGTETLLDVGTRRFPTSWSPDGRDLALYANGPTNTRDLWMLHVDGDKRTPTPFVETPFQERGAIFSPDGRWVAYVSNKSGQNDIYARPYPGPGGEVTISVGGGQEPVWAPSGRELFYRHDAKLLVVRIDQTASSLTVGAPTRVFDDLYRLDTSGAQGGVANYDISPNGQSFVMVEERRR